MEHKELISWTKNLVAYNPTVKFLIFRLLVCIDTYSYFNNTVSL